MNTDEQDRTVCLNQLDPKVTEKLLYELFLQVSISFFFIIHIKLLLKALLVYLGRTVDQSDYSF